MFCPHCGATVPDGAKFCQTCGNTITLQTNAGVNTGYSDPYAQPQQQIAPQPVNQQGYYGNPSYPTGQVPLRTDRDLLMYVLLSIVTCGIYSYWYIYQMAQDANVACAQDGEETPGLLIYILLSIVTCGIYSYYWTYKLANRIQANGPRYGVPIQEGGSDVLLWMILGYFTCSITYYVAMNMIIKNMNALCNGYNHANGLA